MPAGVAEAMRIPAGCDQAQCPFAREIEQLHVRLERIEIGQTGIQTDLAAIKAVATRDRWWLQASMWFVGLAVSAVGIIAAVLRERR